MPFVVDASVALSWLIDADRTPTTDRLLDRAAQEGIVAPSILGYEIANRLGRAVRTGELSRDQVRELLRAFGALDLDTVRPDVIVLTETSADTGLTAYEAAYLEVAKARGIPLATLDVRLRDAALATGVTVLPAPEP